MRFFNIKVLTILILSIVLFSSLIIYFFSINSNTIEVSLKDIKVEPLKADYKGALNNYGLSDTEKDEIWNNINDYKEVRYIFEIKNTSSLAYSVHHRIQPLFSEETKNMLTKSENQLLFPQGLPPGESYKTRLRIIIKPDDQLSDQEILDIVRKDKFTIIGGRVVWVIPFGDESITAITN